MRPIRVAHAKPLIRRDKSPNEQDAQDGLKAQRGRATILFILFILSVLKLRREKSEG